MAKKKAKLVCEPADDEEAYRMPTVWRSQDRLTPTPPPRWLRVFTYPTPPGALDVGCWLLLVSHFQAAEQQDGSHLYTVARDPRGFRVLLVHPSLESLAREWIETINGAISQCNCGGFDCLLPNDQLQAMRVFARRAWPRLSVASRIQLLIERDRGADIGMAMVDQPDFDALINDAYLLQTISEEAG